ncbi:MAG TPA: acetate uptake transporter [Candidatus Baltobacteraceae bacterium]|nr:acetate uptake transporter [Candidatus Baltobacteraceae bacterium]
MVETDRPMPNLHGIEAEHQAVLGDPAALALFAFAVGTFVASAVLTGMWPMAALAAVVPPLLWFAGVGQFIGALFALARGSTFGATAFGSFGMANIVVGTFVWMQNAGLIPMSADARTMLGITLCCFAFIALALAVAALRTNAIYFLTVLGLIPGYALVGANDAGAPAAVGHIGGWFLCAAALLAFYAGAAVVVNSQWCREALPLGTMRGR